NSVFSVRQRASAELAKHGELIQLPLQKYLETAPSLEAQRRATKLLDKIKEPPLTPDRLRSLEGVELLELLATPEARKALEQLARDGLIAQIRLAAAEAIGRLTREKQKTGK